MKKKHSYNHLGLSSEELELLVKNTNDQELLQLYEDRLENCDLSKSAIELINSKDLISVKRISQRILKKYPVKQSSNNLRYLFTSILAVTVLSFLFWIIDPSPKESAITPNSSLNLPAPNQKDIKSKKSSQGEKNQDIENIKHQNSLFNNQKKSNEPGFETLNNKTISIDSIYSPTPIDTVITDKINTDLKRQTKTANNNKFNPSYTQPQRKVQGIRVLQTIPNKFKNENYTASDLVEYQGGDRALEKTIFKKLKPHINDKDIPKEQSTIVFTFNVTSKGKVKTVDIQSLVTSELEERIKTEVLDLSSWDKGKKRIPKDYTVYITFK